MVDYNTSQAGQQCRACGVYGQLSCQGTPASRLACSKADSHHALNAIIVMREWEKGNFDKSTTAGEWRRRQQKREAKLANSIR